jgi:hypothetical protein
MKKGLIACAVLSLLGYFMWGLPNQKQAADVTMPAGKFNSLSYAPYQAWQSPNDKGDLPNWRGTSHSWRPGRTGSGHIRPSMEISTSARWQKRPG